MTDEPSRSLEIEAQKRFPEHRILIAKQWPRAGGFEDAVAAVVQPPGAASDLILLLWFRLSEKGVLSTSEDSGGRAYPIAGVPRAMSTMDVNEDGHAEMIVFQRFAGHEMLQVFALPRDKLAPERLLLETMALDGATSEAGIRELLPLSRGVPAKMLATASDDALIARLSWAKPDQVQAFVPATGVEYCRARDSPGEPKRCRSMTPKQMGEAFEMEVASEIRFGLRAGKPITPECVDSKCLIRIEASEEDVRLELVITGEGRARRLVRVTKFTAY